MRCCGCPYESYYDQEGYTTCRIFGDNDDYIYENKKVDGYPPIEFEEYEDAK